MCLGARCILQPTSASKSGKGRKDGTINKIQPSLKAKCTAMSSRDIGTTTLSASAPSSYTRRLYARVLAAKVAPRVLGSQTIGEVHTATALEEAPDMATTTDEERAATVNAREKHFLQRIPSLRLAR